MFDIDNSCEGIVVDVEATIEQFEETFSQV